MAAFDAVNQITQLFFLFLTIVSSVLFLFGLTFRFEETLNVVSNHEGLQTYMSVLSVSRMDFPLQCCVWTGSSHNLMIRTHG